MNRLLLVLLLSVPAFAEMHFHYCGVELATKETCPPRGESTWEHLKRNFGENFWGGHAVCIDEYLDPNNNGHFTNQECGEGVAQFVATEWGYPRVWNPGSYTYVEGIEYF